MAKKRNQAAKKKEWLNFNKAMLLLLIISLFVIIKTAFMPADSELAKEAEIILDKLTNGNGEINLLNANELVEEKVIELHQMDYNNVKSMLGVKSDFCVYFEDISGNVITIDGISPGIGSNRIYVNGKPCG